MGFVEPAWLWGTLAIAIPIAIHFWHQKRGQPLPWAATFWLTERDQQQSRGLRLDNVWLLLLRCLLLVLLALLLSRPLLNWREKPPTVQHVHLVQPNAFVADNFRFELDEARRKGEKVYWADASLAPFDGNKPKRVAEKSFRFSALTLQSAINPILPANPELHLYVTNDPALAEVPAIAVPARFRLHSVVDSTRGPRAFLTGKNGRKLFVNQAGLLTSSVTPVPTVRLRSNPANPEPLRVLLDYRSQAERQTVRAALNALADVYGLDLVVGAQTTARPYDWVLTDQLPRTILPRTLYVVSGVEQTQPAPNVVFAGEQLTPRTSERVEMGQLPEWLGEQLIGHYGLQPTRPALSVGALKTLFVSTKSRDTRQSAGVQNAFVLLFVVVSSTERWLALTKHA